MGDIVTLTKSQSVRDRRLGDLGKLSKELDCLGVGMLLGTARHLLVDSLLRATGVPVNTSNLLDIAKFLDEPALLELVAKSQGIAQERNRGVKRAKVVSINPGVPVPRMG